MEAQWNIRQNALEVQSFMKDLADWQKEVKLKDSKLQAARPRDYGGSEEGTASPVPGVRGRARPVQEGPPSMPEGEGLLDALGKGSSLSENKGCELKAPAAHTYANYSKWDRFDVDKALTDDPVDVKVPGSRPGAVDQSSGVSQPQQDLAMDRRSNAPLEQPLTAEGWKDRGNNLFKVGELESARLCYDKSLTLAPSCLAYANRALIYLKQGHYLECELDCDRAILLDPEYSKAYQRRGTARKFLGKWMEAAEDFEYALRLEPTNGNVRKERDACWATVVQQSKLPPLTQCQPIKVALPLEPEVPEQQLPGVKDMISALKSSHDSTTTTTKIPWGEEDTGNLGPVEREHKERPGQTQSGTQQDNGPTRPQKTVALPCHRANIAVDDSTQHLESSDFGGVGPRRSAGGHAARVSSRDPRPAEPPVQEPAQSPLHNTKPEPFPAVVDTITTRHQMPSALHRAPPQEVQSAQRGVASAHGVAEGADLSSPLQPTATARQTAIKVEMKAPKNSSDFEAVWRSLQDDLVAQQQFLLMIAAEALPGLFRHALTPQILASILRTSLSGIANSSEDVHSQGHYVNIINWLPKVPRFTMTAMCLVAKDKGELSSLWDLAEQALPVDRDGQLKGIRPTYRL